MKLTQWAVDAIDLLALILIAYIKIIERNNLAMPKTERKIIKTINSSTEK